MPAKFESGNLNVPGIVGLDAGVTFLAELRPWESDHLPTLTLRLVEALSQVEGLHVYSAGNRCGIVSFNIHGYDPREVATMLDSAAGIQVRSGLHCAPLMHAVLGTADSGGAVRASCGHWTTEADIDELVKVVTMLAETPIAG